MIEHLDGGDPLSAVVELKGVLQRDPGDVEARLLLGTAYLQLGRGAAAEKELAAAEAKGAAPERTWAARLRARLLQGRQEEVLDALEALPAGVADAEVALLRGEALLGLSRYPEAVMALTRAAALAPEDPQAFVGLARALLETQEPARAEHAADQALALDPGQSRALLLKGELRRLDGDFAGALAAFERATGGNLAVLARLGRVTALIDLGRIQEAQDELEAMQEEGLRHPLVPYLQAVILTERRDFAAAQSVLQRVEGQLDGHPPALLLQGALHFALGELEQARLRLGRLVQDYPDLLPGRKLLAATLLRLGAAQEAAALLEPGLEQGRRDPQLLFLLGRARLQQGEFSAAAGYLEAAVAAAGGEPGAITRLALGQIAGGRTASAIGSVSAGVAALDNAAGAESGGESGADALTAGLLIALAQLRGDPAGAIETAERLVLQHPDNPLPGSLLGQAYLALGRGREARAAYEAVVAAFPHHMPAQLGLARLVAAEGNLEQAAARTARLAEAHPDSLELTVLRAEIASVRGQADEASTLLEEAVQRSPAAREPRLAQIAGLAVLGRVDDAQAAAAAARKVFPEDPRLWRLEAEIALDAGDPAAGAAIYARLIEADPRNTSLREALATALVDGGEREAAREQLRQAIAIAPQGARAYIRLIDLELADGAPDRAVATAEELGRAVPGSARADQVLGDVYARMGRAAQAAEAYRSAWSKRRSGALAMALYRIRPPEQPLDAALGPLRAWIAANPDDMPARRFLAGELLASGAYGEATAHYETIAAAYPDDALVLNNLAWLYHQAGEPRAAGLAERALAALPETAAVMDTLGWILLDRGEAKRAESLLQQAWKQAPEDPDIAYHYAAALERRGQHRQALKILEPMVAAHDGFLSAPAAEKLLAQLRSR